MDFLTKTAEKLNMKLPEYVPHVLERINVDDPTTFIYCLLKRENRLRFERTFKEIFKKLVLGSLPTTPKERELFDEVRDGFGNMEPSVQPAVIIKLEALAYKLNHKYKLITVQGQAGQDGDSSSSSDSDSD